ncbi:MAG: 5'-3' exonuclease [Actinomycetota bacterium]|nr:5'-3' exonuclease [Actinomycetota bacterium]
MAPRPSLLLLDSASMYFRTFHGVPDTVVAPDGSPVNAVRGFLDAVARLVTEYGPTRLVAAFDADWRPQWRVDLLPSYKEHRVATDGDEEVPDLLSPQVPVIEAALDALGIARVGVAGFEADDVLGTLCAETDCPTDVVTGDRDLFQLVDDARGIRVLYTGKGFARLDRVDEAWVRDKYGVAASQYADFAALRGDPSDGLPGVPGVGDKTAAAVIQEVGSVDAVLAALADRSRELPARAKLGAAADYLAVALDVVRVRTDVPLPDLDSRLSRGRVDRAQVSALGERWGLTRSLDRVMAAMPA